ncbi:hypothetical protein Hamer_G025399 [Homarus americanus]|uniref:Uncharacterized protein n=1 Tax=Homarus americanus TaxID=6706 RepID=A0A8J5JAN4_HOMAM|nr:hypothetical protein Hamer_G025399 [Homarus americanus]
MYVRFWHEAPMAVRAPFNDLQLMKVLKEYPHEKVAHAAQAAISRHLWYLSEHLIGLSLFDDRIDTETKKNMVQNFQCPKKQDFSRRIVLSDETPISNVASFVTERTLDIFDVLTLDGKERAQLFLREGGGINGLCKALRSPETRCFTLIPAGGIAVPFIHVVKEAGGMKRNNPSAPHEQ